MHSVRVVFLFFELIQIPIGTSNFTSTEQAIASFSAIPPKVIDQLQYLADHDDDNDVTDPAQSFSARRAATSTPALATNRKVGIFSSIVGGFLSLFGLTSKRDLDMIVACIEDDEKADVALSYGISDPVKSWTNVQNSTVEGDDDVMLLE
jgi:hypothetical protein